MLEGEEVGVRLRVFKEVLCPPEDTEGPERVESEAEVALSAEGVVDGLAPVEREEVGVPVRVAVAVGL